jgi:hypothetical protein
LDSYAERLVISRGVAHELHSAGLAFVGIHVPVVSSLCRPRHGLGTHLRELLQARSIAQCRATIS